MERHPPQIDTRSSMHFVHPKFLAIQTWKPRQKIAYHLEVKKEASTCPSSAKLLHNCPQFVLILRRLRAVRCCVMLPFSADPKLARGSEYFEVPLASAFGVPMEEMLHCAFRTLMFCLLFALTLFFS